jgi:NADH dehydrogenase FAD-containing subunit
MYRPLFYNTFDKLRDLFDFTNFNDKDIDKKKIGVIGYGWAGRSFCNNIDRTKFDIDIYEKNDYFLNTHKMKFILDSNNKIIINNNLERREAKNINYNNKTINGNKYDIIILSSGSVINDFNIKGVKENCYFLKTYDDYLKLQNKLKTLHKNNKILIIGGGPTGIELGSNLSKHFDNITIIDAFDILNGYTNTTKDYIKLKHNYINFITNEKIIEVNKKEKKFSVNTNKRELDFDLIIYTGGVKSSIDNINISDVYKLGDLNNNGPLTAQKAKQEGKFLAYNLNNNLNQNFIYKENGKLLHLKNEIIFERNKTVLIFPQWMEFIFDLFIDY